LSGLPRDIIPASILLYNADVGAGINMNLEKTDEEFNDSICVVSVVVTSFIPITYWLVGSMTTLFKTAHFSRCLPKCIRFLVLGRLAGNCQMQF
jgi:hypothetical protein